MAALPTDMNVAVRTLVNASLENLKIAELSSNKQRVYSQDISQLADDEGQEETRV